MRRSHNGLLAACFTFVILGLVACTGPAGERGPAGPDGVDGQTGLPGSAGPTGPQGTAGTIGPTGDVGPAGANGDAGPVGPIGPTGLATQTAEACAVCHGVGQAFDDIMIHSTASANRLAKDTATITSVVIPSATTGGNPTINFSVKTVTAGGVSVGVTGLKSFAFTMARLETDTAGNGAQNWHSYINALRYNVNDGGTVVYASAESSLRTTATIALPGPIGTLTELGNGDYSYTMGYALTTTPATPAVAADGGTLPAQVDVAFDPTMIIRFGLQSNAGIPGSAVTVIPDGGLVPATPPFNAFADVDPATSTLVTTNPRLNVQTSACNACHGQLMIHGRRIEVNYCVTCHNPGTTDLSGNTVDAKVFFHKIHMSEALPSVLAGKPYTLGVNNTANFSEVTFPRDRGDCMACHANTTTGPVTTNWKDHPTRAACGSCHDRTSFVDPAPAGWTLHAGGAAADDSSCATLCHAATGAQAITKVHNIPALRTWPYFYKIGSVTNTAPGQQPIVTFQVANAAAATGVPYDIKTVANFQADAGARLAVLIGWSTTDYTNDGTGKTNGQPISIDAVAKSVAVLDGGWFQVQYDGGTVPTNAKGSGVAVLQGRLAAIDGGLLYRVPSPDAVAYFPITDTKAVARRSVVDLAKCNKCHYQLALHGGSRSNTDGCVLCHNPNAVAKVRDGGTYEESIDFKRMVHGIHGNALRKTPLEVAGLNFGGVTYPQLNLLNNCEACHIKGTYGAAFPGVVGTTTSTNGTPTNPANFLRTTKIAATCSSCHDSVPMISHMEQMGGQFGMTQGQIDALNK